MAVGMKDPVLGPAVMRAMAKIIRNCPPPYEFAEGGHFLQEWGEEVAHAALRVLELHNPRTRALLRRARWLSSPAERRCGAPLPRRANSRSMTEQAGIRIEPRPLVNRLQAAMSPPLLPTSESLQSGRSTPPQFIAVPAPLGNLSFDTNALTSGRKTRH
jgi:hypothetical protein